jgi:uncharacterized membrane protein YqjE
VTAHPPTRIDPDSGIPDLIRRLTEDSKRLASDEVRLAKLELHESMRTGVRGTIWLALALAIGVVAAVALTVLLIAAVAAVLGDNYWAGALIIGAVELLVGWLFVRRGVAAVKEPSLTLEVSRAALKDTAQWARHPARR